MQNPEPWKIDEGQVGSPSLIKDANGLVVASVPNVFNAQKIIKALQDKEPELYNNVKPIHSTRL